MTITLTALNGQIPASSLTLIERGQKLRRDAAASFFRAEAAAMPRNCLRSGYRDLNAQAVLVLAGETITKPGESWHGEGLAADVDEPARSWLRFNGAAYGWAKDKVPGERWHFQYDPANDQHIPAPVQPTPTSVTLTPIISNLPNQEDPMYILIHPSRGYWLVGSGLSHLFNQNPAYTDEWGRFDAMHPEIRRIVFPGTPEGTRAFDLEKAAFTQPHA